MLLPVENVTWVKVVCKQGQRSLICQCPFTASGRLLLT